MKTKIKKFRKELKLTQLEVAEAVNVSRQTIVLLEKEKHNPSLILAHRITKKLQKKHIEEVFQLEN